MSEVACHDVRMLVNLFPKRPWPWMPGMKCWTYAGSTRQPLPEGLEDGTAVTYLGRDSKHPAFSIVRREDGWEFSVFHIQLDFPATYRVGRAEVPEDDPRAVAEIANELARVREASGAGGLRWSERVAYLEFILRRNREQDAMTRKIVENLTEKIAAEFACIPG